MYVFYLQHFRSISINSWMKNKTYNNALITSVWKKRKNPWIKYIGCEFTIDCGYKLNRTLHEHGSVLKIDNDSKNYRSVFIRSGGQNLKIIDIATYGTWNNGSHTLESRGRAAQCNTCSINNTQSHGC